MWAYFCWLQKSWVCCLILKTMPSCPGLTPKLHSTIGLTPGSVEHPPLHQWKASRGGHLHFKEKTFSKSVNTFDNNHMRLLLKVFADLEKVFSLKWRCPPREAFHWWRGECSADPEVRLIVECSVGVSPGKEGIVLRIKRQTQDFWSPQKQAHIDYQAHLKSTKSEHRK